MSNDRCYRTVLFTITSPKTITTTTKWQINFNTVNKFIQLWRVYLWGRVLTHAWTPNTACNSYIYSYCSITLFLSLWRVSLAAELAIDLHQIRNVAIWWCPRSRYIFVWCMHQNAQNPPPIGNTMQFISILTWLNKRDRDPLEIALNVV